MNSHIILGQMKENQAILSWPEGAADGYVLVNTYSATDISTLLPAVEEEKLSRVFPTWTRLFVALDGLPNIPAARRPWIHVSVHFKRPSKQISKISRIVPCQTGDLYALDAYFQAALLTPN